jgi:hypothetical protein
MIDEAELRELLDENPVLGRAILQKLRAEKASRDEPPYVAALFGAQKRFFLDPSKKKAAVCSRRAGKTESIAAWLLEGARDSPGEKSVYIALSRNSCRMILWATLQAICRRHSLPLKFKERDNQLVVVTENGHEIWLAGCKDSAEIEKFRGLKLRRAAIDEGASYGPFLRQLVEDVLEPALVDLNGDIAIIGTPGVAPTGYFYEITTGGGFLRGGKSAAKWATHSWSIIQNPYIQLNQILPEFRYREILAANEEGYVNQRAAGYLAEKLEDNRWTEDNPTFRREWLGQWVLDGAALVYPYNPTINELFAKDLPEDGAWVYAIGVDVGHQEPTAFVVGCYRRGHPEIYLVHAEKHEGMIPSAVAVRIIALKKKFRAQLVVMDTGGIGKGYAEECSQRYGVSIQAAEKTKKLAFIEIMRGELLSGNLKVDPREAAELVLEWQNLVWDEKKAEPDSSFEDHLSDAALYLFRALMPHYVPMLVRSAPTEEERAVKLEQDHRNKLKRRFLGRSGRRAALKQALRDAKAGRDMY